MPRVLRRATAETSVAHGVAVRPVGIAGVPSAAVAEPVTSDWERARFDLTALSYWSHARFAEDAGGPTTSVGKFKLSMRRMSSHVSPSSPSSMIEAPNDLE